MSRRPNPGADRAAQNAQTLKALVKLEGNKVCADCKRNKHPRWASWNLGVFVCIRCSGIHRGMGTHISRVKSVDLDAWTDEQLQSVLKWGNTRANKYWEAKLAAGHAPSEAKIENFIRTKYETKRWVMDGPMPDPATLDADDDVPLNIVQEKAKIERSASQKIQAGQPPPIQQPRAQPPPKPAQNVNLFDDFTPDPPMRPNTADLPAPRNAPPAAARQKPQESLLGLDFFGSQQQGAGIGRSASATSTPVPTTHARGDLKNSILSLYASAPKPQPQPQPQSTTHERQTSFGAMTSAPMPQQDAFGGLTDAFGGMSFPSNSTTKATPMSNQSQSSGLAGLSFPSTVPAKSPPIAPQVATQPPLSGGSFFNSAPSKPVPKAVTSKPTNGLDFSFTTAAPTPPAPKPTTASVLSNDLFADDGFNSFASAPSAPTAPSVPISSKPISSAPPVPDFSSAFNLSATTTSPPKSTAAPARPVVISQPSSTMFDPWGSGSDANAWGAPEPTPAKPAAPKVELGSVPAHITPNDISGGWGNPMSTARKPTAPPTVTADEDFGGWTSAPTPAASTNNKSGGFGGASDPFDNPWG